MRATRIAGALSLCLLAGTALADPAPFDLAGPSVQVTVTHAGATLPIAEVPHLAAGDRLSIKADLPSDQSAHYLLVAAFLRGATNPPPDDWFFQSETWTKKGGKGLDITVPDGAQQAVLFLAPATGGDFPTLRNAVRGRPGAFVRASQDLNQASLDRSRLDTYLRAVRVSDPANPDRLQEITPLLARSLTIKINTDCLQKMPELQAACLMQNQDSLVLNDGHSNAITDALSGPGSDLAMQLAATPQGGLGYYSPYIAAVRDIIGILSSFHTAKYQYIPGLGTLADDRLNLVLNAAPSFHNPKSVLVAALPAIAPSRTPPLQPAETAPQLCAQSTTLVLPVSGAPLVYSTRYAHDMALRVHTADGRTIDLPAVASAEKGGFIVATNAMQAADLKAPVDATLHGIWGFQPFDGPVFHLQAAQSGTWRIADKDAGSIVVGHDATVSLTGGAAACVESVTLKPASGDALPARWKPVSASEISVTLPLASTPPGDLTLLVHHPGVKDAEAVTLSAYAEPVHVDGFDLHAGDTFGILRGSGLDGVDTLGIDGAIFRPGALTRGKARDELRLEAVNGSVPAGWTAGQTKTAQVRFKDGRTITLKSTIGDARFGVSLIGKNVQVPATTFPVSIQLAGDDQIPRSAVLTFSLRTSSGNSFTGRETVEVATASGSDSTTLAQGNGLTLEDAHVALATLDGAKAFGPSIFGPIRFRVTRDGTAGDWQPLGTLVRLPVLHQLHCPDDPAAACDLTGENLFLIAALSAIPGFEHPTDVPEGYPGTALKVPHPAGGQLFLKLRDDPGVINRIAS